MELVEGGSVSGVTPHGGALPGLPCEICGKPIARNSTFWCSRRCKDRAYNAAHPVARQARLDFTPAASELAHAIRGRESKAQRILARLRQGPASTMQLALVGGIRFGARLLELRRAGHRITTVEHADHAVYSLEEA